MTDNTLVNQIQTAMKDALRAKDQRRLNAVRLILAAIKQQEIDQRTKPDATGMTDDKVIAVLDKMLKQRRDSIEQYNQAGRSDLAEQEAFEIKVIEEFMPAALSEVELDQIIDQAMAATQAKAASDMGKVMAHVKAQVQGRADMKKVSDKIKSKLA